MKREFAGTLLVTEEHIQAAYALWVPRGDPQSCPVALALVTRYGLRRADVWAHPAGLRVTFPGPGGITLRFRATGPLCRFMARWDRAKRARPTRFRLYRDPR